MTGNAPKRWRRILIRILGAALLAPLLILLLYRFVPPPGTPLMAIRAFEGESIRKDWRTLDEIAPALPQAVVAAEDNRFCHHWGIDLGAMREQVELAIDGETPRGASTISMQLAKNLFLWPGRSILRKGLEAWLTVYVELVLPKRRILELYLNVAEWGHGVYGAEAAAQAHFGVPAAALTSSQASLLAAVLPNPRDWSPASPSGYVAGRARLYRQRIPQLGPAFLGCWERG
ncbi:MAG: monofunctional biosynthetic peptidoglycan transglycosylase [Alphaproteobacteria bacterium]